MRAVQTFVIFYLVEGKKCGLLQGLQQGSCSSAAAFSELLSLQLRFLVLYAHLPFSRTFSEPEVLHVATLSQGTMQCFCSEPFSSPSFLFPVTHARERCSTAELGETSALKLGSPTKLTMTFFSPSISACKYLPLHCQSLSVCIGTAGLLQLLFVLCSHYVLIQPGTPRN